MKEILIDKQIGESWFDEGVTADFVRNELQAAGEDDIRITIDSPGGDVFDCISIYNVIRDFCRTHSNKITTYIRGLAASAASVIALAASDANKSNKVVVESNSVYMIHNGLSFCVGNRHDLRATADRLEKIADKMMNDVYTKRTGKSEKEIEKLMDAETWLYGKEIIDAGFADGFIEEPEAEDGEQKAVFVASAKNNFNRMKIAAQTNLYQRTKGANTKAEVPGSGQSQPDKNTTEGCNMTAEELKKNNPDVYAAIVAEGKAEGVKEERARASSLLKMGELAGCLEVSAEFIRDGSLVADNSVQEKFFERRIAKNALEAQAEDEKSIPNITPPKDANAGTRDNDAVMAAFDKELGGNL